MTYTLAGTLEIKGHTTQSRPLSLVRAFNRPSFLISMTTTMSQLLPQLHRCLLIPYKLHTYVVRFTLDITYC